MYCSDPKLHQYTEVQFTKDTTVYLRYSDVSCLPYWNIMWYKVYKGTWTPSTCSPELESLYEKRTQQLPVLENRVVYTSDPKEQQYTEIVFSDDETPYLRYHDLVFPRNSSLVGVSWYKMNQGTWVPVRPAKTLESKYQECKKQLSATEST